MDYAFRKVEVRKFKRISRKTGESSIVSVSNRNGLSLEEHIRLLNLNDLEFEYEEV